MRLSRDGAILICVIDERSPDADRLPPHPRDAQPPRRPRQRKRPAPSGPPGRVTRPEPGPWTCRVRTPRVSGDGTRFPDLSGTDSPPSPRDLVPGYGSAVAAPVQRDDVVELDIESLAYGGNGVARLN